MEVVKEIINWMRKFMNSDFVIPIEFLSLIIGSEFTTIEVFKKRKNFFLLSENNNCHPDIFIWSYFSNNNFIFLDLIWMDSCNVEYFVNFMVLLWMIYEV
jgi:hypothetical protein